MAACSSNVVFTLVAILTVDSWGRRPLLVTGAIVMAVAMISLGCLFNAQVVGLGLLISAVLYIAGFALSWGPVTWVMLSEMFPNSITRPRKTPPRITHHLSLLQTLVCCLAMSVFLTITVPSSARFPALAIRTVQRKMFAGTPTVMELHASNSVWTRNARSCPAPITNVFANNVMPKTVLWKTHGALAVPYTQLSHG